MRFTSLVPRLRRAADAVGGLLFLALFGVFLLQIVWRFVLHRPLPWTDEAAVVLYVWVILWAAATVVPQREQVMFDLVWNFAGPRLRRGRSGLGLRSGILLTHFPPRAGACAARPSNRDWNA